MRATGSQQLMVVTLHAPQRSGFYEVWLLARNGVSMISLGDLNPGEGRSLGRRRSCTGRP